MAQPPLLIRSEADVTRGVTALCKACAVLQEARANGGPPPLRLNPGGLPGLLRIVIGQQVSVASAAAIWQRFVKVAGPVDAAQLLRRRESTLRKAGLSGPKLKTVRAVSRAVVDGVIDFDAYAVMSADDVRRALTAVHGIGPWTADIYVMFCLGHADGWAPGDLALQIELATLLGEEERMSAKELDAYAERWRPWRSVAARMLWASYQARRGVSDAIPA
ncbi:MAG: DNA-3-methyladenine glycosylase 2 family protein [Pseudomonadota bacterium]